MHIAKRRSKPLKLVKLTSSASWCCFFEQYPTVSTILDLNKNVLIKQEVNHQYSDPRRFKVQLQLRDIGYIFMIESTLYDVHPTCPSPAPAKRIHDSVVNFAPINGHLVSAAVVN